MERNNTFTTMMEELNYQEMSEIKGGAMSYCETLEVLMDGDYARDNWTATEWRNAISAYRKHC